uniref:5'-AMP-activated protein kinase subunit beta-1 n=1 Tax=Lepeophtheirus salmonis TaxID=72036 RepID=C1BU14_LEPSM|nr:5-AMP-activated protein kinase subunit beta-2 [Lepeophtheirus salmonis]
MGNSGSNVGSNGEKRKGVGGLQGRYHFGRSRGIAFGDMNLGTGQPLDIITSPSTPKPNRRVDDLPVVIRPRAGTESYRQKPKNDAAMHFPKALPTIFKYSGKGKEVFVSGSFNNWAKIPMVQSSKDFTALAELQEGDHEYKFLVDGTWLTDPNTPCVSDNKGDERNIIHIQKEDFDAYHALDMDSEAVSKLQKHTKGVIKYSPTFGQEIPQTGNELRSGPPILPPHLLHVLLNKDTPLSCEPTLLPEPHHVMINHLYALSIKDGVLVLSSTQRFRKKYVTTLLYKPMGTRVANEKH